MMAAIIIVCTTATHELSSLPTEDSPHSAILGHRCLFVLSWSDEDVPHVTFSVCLCPAVEW